MQKPLKVGVVGLGSISQAHIQAIGESDYATVAAVADVREEAVRATSESVGCPGYTSHEKLLIDTPCDAVLVCTPPSTHKDICIAFLENKIPVLCEKPLSVDVESAMAMQDAAKRNDTVLTMASKFRFVEDVARAKSIVASGILGEIILFGNAFTARVNMADRWNSNPRISGGGVLIDNGTHSVDIIRYFLGPIAEVNVVEGKRVRNLPVEDTVQMFVRTVDGVMGTVDLSWSLQKDLDNFIDIYGSNGAIHVGWRESKYRQSSSSDWMVFGHGYDKIRAFRRNIENFCRALLGEEMLLVSTEDAIASVEVIEAAYKSLAENHWIRVNRRNDATES
jgi:predicted dehydrogenase